MLSSQRLDVRKGEPSWTMPNPGIARPCSNKLHVSSGYPGYVGAPAAWAPRGSDGGLDQSRDIRALSCVPRPTEARVVVFLDALVVVGCVPTIRLIGVPHDGRFSARHTCLPPNCGGMPENLSSPAVSQARSGSKGEPEPRAGTKGRGHRSSGDNPFCNRGRYVRGCREGRARFSQPESLG
jgi:hypothetical protein